MNNNSQLKELAELLHCDLCKISSKECTWFYERWNGKERKEYLKKAKFLLDHNIDIEETKKFLSIL